MTPDSSPLRRAFVNMLTLSRVPLIFAFAAAAVCGERCGSFAAEVAACALMALAGFSDLFDGLLARRWRVVSAFGKLADPIMDKVFFIVSFPTLLWMACVQGESPAHAMTLLAFTILYILRDQWVTFLRAVAAAYRADVSAMWIGKVRTALSFPAAGLVYFYLAFHRFWPAQAADCTLALVYAVEAFLIALNVWSCASYTRVYWPYVKKSMSGEG